MPVLRRVERTALLEVHGDSGGEADVVLTLVYAVFETGVEIIGLDNTDGKGSGESEIDAAAGLNGQGVRAAGEPGGGRGREQSSAVRDAEQTLNEGRDAMSAAESEPRPGHEGSEIEIRGGAIDVVGALVGALADQRNVIGEVPAEPDVATLHVEAAASAGSGIGAHEVISRTDFEATAFLSAEARRKREEKEQSG